MGGRLEGVRGEGHYEEDPIDKGLEEPGAISTARRRGETAAEDTRRKWR